MYCDFFGLRCNPFEDRTDAQFFYATPERKKILAAVEKKRGYLLPYHDFASRVAIHRFVQDIPTSAEGGTGPSYREVQAIEASLPQFRDRPMLICWGMRDFCFNEAFLKGWIERFPEAQVHRFPDAGHYVVEDAGEAILPLVRDFLA